MENTTIENSVAENSNRKIIDGKSIAARLVEDISQQAQSFRQKSAIQPGLAVCIVGDNPASRVYVRAKEKRAQQAGFHSLVLQKEAISQEELLAQIDALNDDPKIHGILVQLPLPQGLEERTIIERIAPHKDVDGFHTENSGKLMCGIEGAFVPCTPLGCLHLLRCQLHTMSDSLEGKNALVVGRSNIVGKPMAALLLAENATVTIAHSKTRNLPELCQSAELLIAAVGRANFIKGEWVKQGAIVIDVGINRAENGALLGDVEFDKAQKRAAAITPVPGGVGPMTIAMLLWNTLVAAHKAAGFKKPEIKII